MDYLTFIVEITKAIIWPVVVLFIAFNFKHEVSKLLLRISKFKHKDTQIDFAETVEKLIEDNIERGMAVISPDKNDPLHEEYEMLMRLAEISPRAAVLEAFRVLEIAMFDALPEDMKNKIRNPIHAFSFLYKNKFFSEQDYFQFNKLRSLRNQAAHDEEFNLKGTPIESYIDIALSVAHHIKQEKENEG